LPSIPGREVAGRLDDGTRVVVHLGRAPHAGGYAELVAANASTLHELPDHVDAADAVTAIGTGRTALLMLDGVVITPDDFVLVRGAAGGIGHLLVQSALHVGATVYGEASPAKHDALRALGARVGPCEPTLVLDTTSPPSLQPPSPDEQRALEARALDLVATGIWQSILTSFALRDAAAAHRAIELRTSVGKVVLVP
jgi:NADPH2:quinone reductase